MPIRKPEMLCPICGEKCMGGLALHKHLSTFHSEEEVEALKANDAAEFEANHNEIRDQERLDNFIEFGG